MCLKAVLGADKKGIEEVEKLAADRDAEKEQRTKSKENRSRKFANYPITMPELRLEGINLNLRNEPKRRRCIHARRDLGNGSP